MGCLLRPSCCRRARIRPATCLCALAGPPVPDACCGDSPACPVPSSSPARSQDYIHHSPFMALAFPVVGVSLGPSAGRLLALQACTRHAPRPSASPATRPLPSATHLPTHLNADMLHRHAAAADHLPVLPGERGRCASRQPALLALAAGCGRPACSRSIAALRLAALAAAAASLCMARRTWHARSSHAEKSGGMHSRPGAAACCCNARVPAGRRMTSGHSTPSTPHTSFGSASGRTRPCSGIMARWVLAAGCWLRVALPAAAAWKRSAATAWKQWAARISGHRRGSFGSHPSSPLAQPHWVLQRSYTSAAVTQISEKDL